MSTSTWKRMGIALPQGRGLKLAALVGVPVAIGILVGTAFIFGIGGACASREAASEKVAVLAADLQKAASEGQLSIDTLAGNMRRMNELAAVYESSGDVRTYCEGLDQLRDEFALKQ